MPWVTVATAGAEAAPDGNDDTQDIAAVAAVAQVGHGNAERDVHRREGESRQEAHCGVAGPQFVLDRYQQDGHDLPVEVVYQEDDRQQQQGVP